MSKEEVQKNARPRGDGSGKGRGTGQKRKRGDEDEEETESWKDFRDWLENRAMKTESAIQQLSRMMALVVDEMEELKKKEKMRSKVMRRIEQELTEFRSETSEGMKGFQDGVLARLDELQAELVEGSKDGENGEDGADGETEKNGDVQEMEVVKEMDKDEDGEEEEKEDEEGEADEEGKADGEDGDVPMHED
jgi:hypothetical protein